MKTILKTLTLAALLFAVAPAQAMYKNLGKAFRTAVMNRTLTTKQSAGTNARSIKKPLIAAGALVGIGGVAYVKSGAYEMHKLNNQIERFMCSHYLASNTRAMLTTKKIPSNQWFINHLNRERPELFTQCLRVMPLEEFYTQNINHLIKEKNEHIHSHARDIKISKEMEPLRDAYILKMSGTYDTAIAELQRELSEAQTNRIARNKNDRESMALYFSV